MNQWQTMISELRNQGLTQTQIGMEIGCSQNYVSDLERGVCGKRLSHGLATKLQKLWKKHCKTKQVA
ncbi:XRE family transcriptional regulator [Acinetobacter radioresistens]|jgi:transcriptional regulator with XRE-family HTH domain|uniref:helix-turn-helix domain-containing protein n=1 Tax=Acinetobacter radioresistens TaxID=40216 RepID=UPI000946601D|nr:helix-turn-helix transcriptional regulator [Acinetobacter radioresistens]QCS11857.1 XRE family transcriptional regulator [Acinetobacter radioresistens]